MSKPNDVYWAERFQLLEAIQNEDGRNVIRKLKKAYEQATKDLEKDLAYWYSRFAGNEGISLADARKMLSTSQLKDFRMTVEEYISKGESLDPKWRDALERASIKVHVSRLEALKLQLQQHAEETASRMALLMDEYATSSYKKQYYHTAFEIQKGIGLGWDLQKLDDRQVAKVVRKPWAADGTNFSERVWDNRTKLVNELHTTLTSSIARGENPTKTIDKLADKMDNSLFNAGRVVMTEGAFFASTAKQDCFADLDVDWYEYVATLDLKTSQICRDLDGKIFERKDYIVGTTAPPLHPFCVLPDTKVVAPNADALMRTRYLGDVFELISAKGRRVTVTANHIMLTTRGWIRAKDLVEGDQIIYYSGWDKPINGVDPANDHGVATIKDCFTALSKASSMATTAMPATAIDFKGDAIENEKIEIIDVDSLLRNHRNMTGLEFAQDRKLIFARDVAMGLDCKGSLNELLMGLALIADGVMSCERVASIFFGGALRHHELISLLLGTHYHTRLLKSSNDRGLRGAELSRKFLDTSTCEVLASQRIGKNSQGVCIANSDAILTQNAIDRFAANTIELRKFCDRFAGAIELDQLIRINKSFYSGHVYDLSTESTLYICNGIITSNCRSTTAPYFADTQDAVRVARNAEGEVYEVPAKMSYHEWEQSFIDGGDKKDLTPSEPEQAQPKTQPLSTNDEFDALRTKFYATTNLEERDKILQDAGSIFKDKLTEAGFFDIDKTLQAEYTALYDKAQDFFKEHTKPRTGEWDDPANQETYRRLWTEVQTFSENYSYRVANAAKAILSKYRKLGFGDMKPTELLTAGRIAQRKRVIEALDCYPQDWLRALSKTGPYEVIKIRRGHFDAANKQIAINDTSSHGYAYTVAIHELGHGFEYSIQSLRMCEAQFFDRRTQGCKLEKLNELIPMSGYDDYEVTYKDDFISPYMGKDYDGRAFELASMGFQYLFTEPKKLARDEDMLKFILGLLVIIDGDQL